MKTIISLIIGAGLIAVSYSEVDLALQQTIENNQLELMKKPTLDSLKVELGQKLFFDKILSGNKDVSCATCHHPLLNSTDGLALPIGVGGTGLGENRVIGYKRTHVPRNSPDVFNRGNEEWHTMFWDSRVSITDSNEFETPADEKLPNGLENILAVQAMFPVTSRDEMRGEIGDTTIYGEENELALISNAAPQSVWLSLMQRLLDIPEYVQLFEKVYPEVPLEKLGFQHAANAIAAFEIDAFTFLDSPWDQYLGGETEALNEDQKAGALLFYGKAGCSNCHSGNLMTDQQHHNIGIPQFGPGRGDTEPLDVGRYAETGQISHRFAFRTPPLRNVALTAPYMHNGAYTNLRDVIIHHLYPENSLSEFDPSNLPGSLKDSYNNDEKLRVKILSSIDTLLINNPPQLTQKELISLEAFLLSLTEEGLNSVSSTLLDEVPSGIPVDTD